MISWLDGIFTRIFSRGSAIEIGTGIDFLEPLTATINPTTKRVEVTAPGGSGSTLATTTASFAQPAVDANVSVSVTTTEGFALGAPVFVEGGGAYLVDSIDDGTHVTLTNAGADGNAVPTTVVAGGSRVTTTGAPGANGANGADGSDGTMVTVAVDYCSTAPALTLSGSQTVDGGPAPNGSRVLWAPVAGHIDAGTYVVNTGGAWVRATDQDSSAEIDSRPLIQIKNGTTLAGRVAILSTPAPITLGVTVLTFQVSLRAPEAADAGKFVAVDSSGDHTFSALSIKDSIDTLRSLLITGAMKLSASLRLDVDDEGNLAISRGDSVVLTDYPYNARAATWSTTATGTSGVAAITVASAAGIKRRDCVAWLGAGAAHTLATPATPVASVTGTAGTLDLRYRLVARLEDQGISIRSPQVTVATAPDCLLDTVTAPGTALTGLLRCDWAPTANLANLSAVPGLQDGFLVRVGDDVLLYAQTAPAENGVYAVTADNGDGTFTIARGASMDTAAEATRGRRIHVASGTVNGGKYFRITSASVTTLGTDPIVVEPAHVDVRPYGADCDGVIKTNVTLASVPTAQPGYTIAAGYRILVVGQTATAENGVYTAGTPGGGNVALTRDTSWDQTTELLVGAYFRVARGTDARTAYFLTTAPATVGTNPCLFTLAAVYQWDVWRAPGAGAEVYLGAFNAMPLLDGVGAVLQDVYFRDVGAGAATRPSFIASTSPTAARANTLFARITAISGTNVTISPAPSTSATATDFRIDNSTAFSEAMAAAPAGSKLVLPANSTAYWTSRNLVESKKLHWRMRGAIIRWASGFGWECPSAARYSSHKGGTFNYETATLPCGGKYVSHDVAHHHGAAVLCRTESSWEDLTISSSTATLYGSGFALIGRDVNGDNANRTKVRGCYADSCTGHGFVAYGSDVNVSTFADCSSTSAGGWGFYGAAFLGLTLDTCHGSDCLRGAFCSEATVGDKWTGCYSESGQGASLTSTTLRCSGGDHGAGFVNPNVGSIEAGSYRNPLTVTSGRPAMSLSFGDKIDDNRVARWFSAGKGLDFRWDRTSGDKLTWYFNGSVVGTGVIMHGRYEYGQGIWQFPKGILTSSTCKIGGVPSTAGTPSWPNAVYTAGSFYNAEGDGSVTGYKIVNPFALTSSSWAASASKQVGNIVKPTTPNGYAYVCSATSGDLAGNTAGSEPTWPTSYGATVVDNGVTWKNAGADTATANFAVVAL